MDQLDKKLYNDLNIDIGIPDELDTVIKRGLNRKKKHVSLLRKVASFFIITFITSGIVFAGSVVYEKNVWKEPERVVVGSAEHSDNQNEPKQNTMSEDEARKKANEILEKFGYKNDKIKTMELQDNIDDYDSIWNIKTEQNISIGIYANGDGSFSIGNGNIYYNDIEHYRTTKEEAVKTAREIAQKYGYDTKDYSYVRVEPNINSDEKESYRYNITFCKEYDGIRNPYESINITFIPQINEVEGFIFYNKKYENNPVDITKEKAEEIVLSEEHKLRTKYEMYEIEKIETELRIVQMNGYAHIRLNDYEQLHEQTSLDYPYEKWVFYRVDSRIRKAWVVSITYDTNNVDKFNGKYNPNDERFSYFIDATTGEVIGGGSTF